MLCQVLDQNFGLQYSSGTKSHIFNHTLFKFEDLCITCVKLMLAEQKLMPMQVFSPRGLGDSWDSVLMSNWGQLVYRNIHFAQQFVA